MFKNCNAHVTSSLCFKFAISYVFKIVKIYNIVIIFQRVQVLLSNQDVELNLINILIYSEIILKNADGFCYLLH